MSRNEAAMSRIFQWVLFVRSQEWMELTVICSWLTLPMLSMTTVARRHFSTNGSWAAIRCWAVATLQPVRSRSLCCWTSSELHGTHPVLQLSISEQGERGLAGGKRVRVSRGKVGEFCKHYASVQKHQYVQPFLSQLCLVPIEVTLNTARLLLTYLLTVQLWKNGLRLFPVAASILWNSLPPDI